MNYLIFWAAFIVLAAIIFFFDRKYGMLRDNGTGQPRPYSFSRVQLAWWTLIIISSVISIIIVRGDMPTFNTSTLYLLGISSATTIGATLIDINDKSTLDPADLAQNMKGQDLFIDILSDKNGINIHRFQTVVFNIIFGVWFIISVLNKIGSAGIKLDDILPVIADRNLILLGVSSGVYAALKTTENKQPLVTPPDAAAAPADVVTDEAKPQG